MAIEHYRSSPKLLRVPWKRKRFRRDKGTKRLVANACIDRRHWNQDPEAIRGNRVAGCLTLLTSSKAFLISHTAAVENRREADIIAPSNHSLWCLRFQCLPCVRSKQSVKNKQKNALLLLKHDRLGNVGRSCGGMAGQHMSSPKACQYLAGTILLAALESDVQKAVNTCWTLKTGQGDRNKNRRPSLSF